MPLGVWLPLVAEHHARADLSRWGLMVTITAAAAFNSVMEPISNFRFGRQLASPPQTPPPLFIIGHWRSGTTLLHELAMLDDRFCCPNYYQCYAPGHFLLTERTLAPLVKLIVPAKRPMDDMAAGLDRPQEDEFALMNLGAPSPYRRMAFPVTSPPHPVALDVTKLPPAELARWQATLRRFLGLLAVADARRMPKMQGFIAGDNVFSQDAQSGSLGSLPALPAGIDAPGTADYIRAVMDGTQPVPAPIAQQVIEISKLISRMENAA
jgi:hypothetical protein